MYAPRKYLFYLLTILVGTCVAGSSLSPLLKHHTHTYKNPPSSFFDHPVLLQQHLFEACSSASFGLMDVNYNLNSKDYVYVAVSTHDSWVCLCLDYKKRCIHLDCCILEMNEERFFIVKKLLDILFGLYTDR